MARQKPLVLIFENMHLADSASRDFLDYLSRTVSNEPLLLLIATRSAERQTTLRPLVKTIQQHGDRLTDIQLQPLSEAESSMLVDHMFARNTNLLALKQQIITRSRWEPALLAGKLSACSSIRVGSDAIPCLTTGW
jgi:predicted ATPase